ncbi:ABC transporter ATP-binding protein [Leucobacter allii]|uniref:ABC transporter ATP-binding protein n=1 Tax=Leucobacter allii TaxID=2932247 RepID=A0ABY4FID4_9MICO|nr:ABC transporter ATP-binding protein [Leucobacter allii]UOQ56440.1 ABC transporter ATP-binding protein [Leucobacter allii]UOR00874.1 ABC transporter ATP-binding protein [Leucobacter allii]
MTDTAAAVRRAPEGLAFRIRDLVVSFGTGDGVVTPLQGLDLEVPRGQFLCILGPSGQGKSTLLRCMTGLQAPTSGTVEALGAEVEGPNASLGMVFQQDAIPMWLRVKDNVSFGPRMRGVPQQEWAPRVEHFIDAVGLRGRERAWPRQLSGGMRKRAAIAAVFANDPDVLLMDEPFGSLDYFTRATLHNTLLALWEETGKTIVFVTHDVDEALKLADRIVVVSNGVVGADLPVAFERPRTDGLRTDPEADAMRRYLLEELEAKAMPQ